MNLPAWGCLVCVGVLVVAELRQAQGLRVLSKVGAAALMVLCAVVGGAGGSAAGRRILVGLALSAGGDVCLLSRSRPAFMAGLSLFLLAHLAYAAAALTLGAPLWLAVVVSVPLWFVARRVWRWLSPHVPSALRIAVLAYMVAISAMVALALATTLAGHAPPRFAAGAILFFVSDLAVARERFVVGSVVNKLWGLPAYFGGQLLIATTVVG